MKLKINLREKLLIVTTSIVLIAFSVNTYLNINDFINRYKEMISEKIFAEAKHLRNIIEDTLSLGLGLGELEGLNEECEKLKRSVPYAQYCFVSDLDGKIIYQDYSKKTELIFGNLKIKEIRGSGQRDISFIKTVIGSNIYNHSLLIHDDENHLHAVGMVHIGVLSEVVNKEIRALIQRSVLLSSIFIIFTVLIVILFNRHIVLAPLRSIMIALAHFGKGELDYKIDLKQTDEFGELAKTFNKMTENLNIVTASRDDLDAQIKERIKAEKALQEANKGLALNERALKNILYDLRKAHDELKSTQKQLVQSEKLASIGQLAAGIAHEINNPVGFIGSNLSTLEQYIENISEIMRALENFKQVVEQKDLNKAEKIRVELQELEESLDIEYILNDLDSLLRESKEGVERIKKIVMDLKTFSRSDDEIRIAANINQVIDGTVNIVWNEIKYKAELNRKYGEVPLVECNTQQIGQVFINLLVNAAQSIADKGVITIETYKRENEVVVEVSDTGKGIKKELLAKIFDPFFTTKEVGKGTGLGLSISHEIITKHNGTITVESEVGKGTKFTVVFPVSKNI